MTHEITEHENEKAEQYLEHISRPIGQWKEYGYYASISTIVVGTSLFIFGLYLPSLFSFGMAVILLMVAFLPFFLLMLYELHQEWSMLHERYNQGRCARKLHASLRIMAKYRVQTQVDQDGTRWLKLRESIDEWDFNTKHLDESIEFARSILASLGRVSELEEGAKLLLGTE